MFNVIDMYCKYVLKPVEEHTKELRIQVANKSIVEKIFNIDYKDKALDKYKKEDANYKLNVSFTKVTKDINFAKFRMQQAFQNIIDEYYKKEIENYTKK